MSATGMRFAKPAAPRNQLVLCAPSLDELVAPDAEVRVLACLLEDVDWAPWELEYKGFGQPPIHPRYMAGAILFGLLKRFRSSRQLEEAARKHLDFIWLLEGFTPDHSTFAVFRVRHKKAIRALHRELAGKLVMRRGEELLRMLVDGTRLRADSDRHGMRRASTMELIIDELERRLNELAANDALLAHEARDARASAPQAHEEALARIEKDMARLEAQRTKYRKALEVARERDAQARKHDGRNARPARVPVTDPDAQVTPNKEGGYAPNYTPVAAVEPVTGAIVYGDVLSDSDEAGAVQPAVEAMEALTGSAPEAVLADGNFATGEVLASLDANGIEAYMPTRSASPPDNPALRPDPAAPVPVKDRQRLPKRGDHLARTAFVYDAGANLYRCPMGHALKPFKNSKSKGVSCTHYQGSECPGCPLARECIRGRNPMRTIVRDEYEDLREDADRRMATDEGKALYRTRAPGIEGVFGIIKAGLGIRRFTVRGLDKVRTEWAWICTAYNLKKLLAREARTPTGRTQPPRAPLSNALSPSAHAPGHPGTAHFALRTAARAVLRLIGHLMPQSSPAPHKT